MRFIKILIAFVLISAAALAARQWGRTTRPNSLMKVSEKTQVSVRPELEITSQIPRGVEGKYDLMDVALLDEKKAWAVGYDGQHVNRVYYSTDTGATWQPIEVLGRDFTFHAISFVDSQHGWAVGGNGLLIRTIDGGKSWELLKTPTKTDLHSVRFVNSMVGYIAGNERFGSKTSEEVWGSVEILCTKDAGETWRRCYKENQPLSVFQITTPSESEALVVLGDHVMRTEDKGKTWQKVQLSEKYISSIAFAADGTGWLVGSHGAFQVSHDRGKTWERAVGLPDDFVKRDWWQVAFNDKGTGLAVGENDTLALTTDNGQTWKLEDLKTGDHLRAVRLQGFRAIILGSQNAYSIRLSN